MGIQVVFWKPIRSRSVSGKIFKSEHLPKLIDSAYRSQLLYEIISMEPKKPISFEDAANLMWAEFTRASDAGQIGTDPGQSHWYYRNFVKWIADQGYSIELTGEEFETASIASQVA
jgi:hypothetical protein